MPTMHQPRRPEKIKRQAKHRLPSSLSPYHGLLVLDDRAGDLGLIAIENPAPEPILLDLRIEQGVSVLALDCGVVGAHESLVLSNGNDVEQHDTRCLAAAGTQG